MIQKSIVVAHYKEDISWLDRISDSVKIYIYCKGDILKCKEFEGRSNFKIETLKNIGNEGQTYFHHIVNNYETLEDIVYFIQADPHEHSINFMEKLNNNFIGGISDFNLITSLYGTPVGDYHAHINHKYENISHNEITGKIFIDPWNDKDACDNINFAIDSLAELNIKKENWVYNANGLYAVDRDSIKKFNLDFYKKCLSLFDEKATGLNMMAFAFERIIPGFIFK
jgi:hypothetical protein